MIAVKPPRQKGARVPVIGRLDGQVEEVIINPIGRRRADEDDAAPHERAPQEPAAAMRPEPPAEQQGERREATELPVWLL